MHAFLDLSSELRCTAENTRQIDVQFPSSDPVFSGHYPDYPVYPASLIVETCCALMSSQCGINIWGGAAWVLKNSRFTGGIRPGDTATVTMTGETIACRISVRVGETVVATLNFETEQDRAPVELADASQISMGPASRFLLQRYPLMVIDLVGLSDDRKSGAARKMVSYGDYAFRKFTPEGTAGAEPVYPIGGVIEGIEQAAAVVLSQQWDFTDPTRVVLVVSLRGVRFFGSAGPGDVISFATQLDMSSDGLATLSGIAHTGDRMLMSIDKVVVIRKDKLS